MGRLSALIKTVSPNNLTFGSIFNKGKIIFYIYQIKISIFGLNDKYMGKSVKELETLMLEKKALEDKLNLIIAKIRKIVYGKPKN